MADKNRVLEKLKKEGGGGGVIKLFTRLSFNGTDTYIYSMFARSRSLKINGLSPQIP